MQKKQERNRTDYQKHKIPNMGRMWTQNVRKLLGKAETISQHIKTTHEENVPKQPNLKDKKENIMSESNAIIERRKQHFEELTEAQEQGKEEQN